MKIIDSKGKLFGKINIVDLLVVLALIVLVCSAIIKFDKAENHMTSDKVIEYTMKISQVRQPTIDALNKNLKSIKNFENEKELGEITDIKMSKAKELVHLNDGTYKEVYLEDKYDLMLTVKVEGTETEDNYYTLSGQKIIVGENLSINNDYVTSYGIIKSVEVVSE